MKLKSVFCVFFFLATSFCYGVAEAFQTGDSFIISSTSRDIDPDMCLEGWIAYRQEAELFADRIGSARTTLINPSEQTIVSSAPVNSAFVFNVGHSAGPRKFIAECDGSALLATVLPMSDMLFASGCDTLCSTDVGTFSTRAKATVGFCDLANPINDPCLQKTLPLERSFLEGLVQGMTVGDAFQGALLENPECQGVFLMAGGPTVKLYAPPAECGSRATEYFHTATDWPTGSGWCKFGSSEGASFPNKGETSSWTCAESEGGTSVQCPASRGVGKSVLSYMPVILSAGKK